jgi:hypothetical protein
MPTTTATSYSRTTISGRRKTVTYYKNGKKMSLNSGRRLNVAKAGVRYGTSGWGTRAASRSVGAHEGNVRRVVTYKNKKGGGRIKAYTVGRSVNARTDRKSRQTFIAKAGGRQNFSSSLANKATFTHGTTRAHLNNTTTRKAMRHSGGNRRPPQLTTAQRRNIARRRRRGAGGKFA